MGKLVTKFTSILMSIAMVFSICGVSYMLPGVASPAYADDAVEASSAGGLQAATIDGTKAAGDLTVLAFTSDTHNKDGNVAANRLGTWLDNVANKYGKKVDVMAFGGDMANASASEAAFWTLTQADMDQLTQRSVTGVYTTGNHEYSPGNYSNGKNTTTQKYVENTEGIEGTNYRIYCLGSSAYAESSGGWMGGWNTYSSSQVSKLNSYLNSKDESKPIIVITHYPLHYTSSRTISGAGDVIDALNTAASSGKKIVYLWGHNHTDAPRTETNYDQIFKPGDTITYGSNQSKTIQFYYGAAGCMSDSEYGTGSGSVKGKGLVITINSQNQLSFAYLDANAGNVTENGSGGQGTDFTEQDPVAVTGVEVSPATASVLEKKTVQLTATVTPTDATNRAVRWSSSDTSIATVDEKGLVKGVKEGTATITATTVDGGYTASSTVTVQHNDNPSVEETIDITPTTDNPEESIKIGVGDTLTVNVTNGSSNSAYDFTATLSKNGVAQVVGGSTQNIAAGATGQFTFEGVADGTVDITIQNSNTYGSQYVRKGVIHLTVGEGGDTPVDPPTGDTVNITPTTDNPEESIKIGVGDTLTVNVTNGSSNSAYDFTATLSKNGVAQVVGGSTQNIAAGATGQFTFEGVADGTVDITIQNNQSSSQYVRKGVIHLTVGEGGDTPVDPPTGDTVNITPTTDNPEESIKIGVGDTLTVNVTNGSSNSAYDFTATLGSSGIAQIQGSSTQNIAAGATGQFTVKGLAEGTVDITIQNSNSYGSQYVRKGVIHLTVGEGGDTPVDPPTGDTVTYQLTDTLKAGKEYVIASGNTGNVYVVSTDANGSRTLKGIAATVSNDMITLSAADAAKASFMTEDKGSVGGSVSVWLKNGGQYLYADSSSGLRMVGSSTQAGSNNSNKVWHYKADGKDLLWFFNSNTADGYTDTSSTYKYYLECTNGNFTDNHVDSTSLENSDTPKIYLFEKYEGPLEVTGVSLDKTALTLTVGKIATLTATVVPSGATNKDVTWTSSNSAVATVDVNGRVSAVAAGTATITVTTVENNKTATCLVTVKEAGTGTDYVLTDTLEAGKEYLIANGNTGNVYVVSNEETGTARQLKGVAVSVVGDVITIDDEIAPKVVFEAEDKGSAGGTVSVWLKNGGQYLYTNNADGLRMVPASEQGSTDNAKKVWHYKADGKDLLWFFNSNTADGYTDNSQTYKYYLECNNGVFTDNHASTTSLANTNTPKVYLFVKDEGSTPPHTHAYGEPSWSWTGDDASGYTAATASFTCVDNDDTQTLNAAVTSSTVGNTTTYTATVSFMGKTYTDTKTVTAAVVTYTFKDFSWTGNDSAGYTAAVANYTGSDGSAKTVNATVTSETTAASCEVAGKTIYTALVTEANSLDGVEHSDTKTVAIQAIGHDWNDPTYEWADDNATVTATRTCKNDATHVQTETVDTTSQSETASCTEPGSVTYTATFKNTAFATQTKTVSVDALGHDMTEHEAVAATCEKDGNTAYWSCERCGKLFSDEAGENAIEENSWVLPATGHDWNAPSYTWSDDYTTVTAERTCKNDATHVDTETVSATAEEVAATCTTAGERTWTSAAFKNDAFEVQMTTETIDALGHKMTEHEAIAATCTEEGSSAYWSCERCSKYFSDEAGTTEIDEDSWVIAALGHAWGEPEWTWADDNSSASAKFVCANGCGRATTVMATITTEIKEATCTESGEKVYTATAKGPNGVSYTDAKSETIEALGHDYAEVVTAPTCTEKGYTTYTCSRCGDSYTDNYIDATGHAWGEPAWTWTGSDEDGYTAAEATFTCANDAAHMEKAVDEAIDVVTVPATPTEHGSVTYTASVTGPDGKAYGAEKVVVIPAAGYTFKDPVYTWTGTESGYSVTALKECNEDPALNIAETVDAEYSVTTEATCTEGGKGLWTATFSKTDFEVQTKEVDIPATGHAWGEPTYEWADDNSSVTAKRACKNDAAHEESEKATVSSEVTKEATCETMGETTYTATFENEAFETQAKVVEDIPATGHDWGAATYEWSADNSTVTATRTCNNDSSHVETETAGATSEEAKPATCETMGETTYTATFENEAFEAQSKIEVIPAAGHDMVAHAAVAATCTSAGNSAYWTCSVCKKNFSDAEGKVEIATGSWAIPAAGHKWGEPTYTWSADGSACTAERACSVCGEKESETAKAASAVNSDGSVTYTAAFKGAAFAKQAKKRPLPDKVSGEVSPSSPASAKAVDKQITSAKSDKDQEGTTFGLLQASGKAKSKTSVKLTWKAVPGATAYAVYGNKCGKANHYELIKTVKGKSFTHKKLKRGTYYKYMVVALKGSAALATSKTIHVATKGGKVGNSKSVKVTSPKGKKATLKVGGKVKVKAKAVAQSSKLKVKKHRAITFETSNPKVATVSAKGLVKAVGKGKCYVYAYSQNGKCAKVTVTVK